ncbi:cytochrome c biogenesis protein CcdC [Virgibacillus sp. 179-BFC.A HS]|uniref:Cytochrome c biogenesis protein CcdC n=1 Tax=Tigheibacillus jepli TaxID=3035914 RepID=A0ABU5CJY0_9BACI|nr:cytochrome c biogenesis protein CcdC [Virgibacillus sp. 179-BFC.A HS]MDY0405790.1 cytochrome c biogenesis protein CcdC [Virgibacillus sp. 179-BFC.A HS]
MIWIVGSTFVFVFMATTMIFVRMKAAKKPASVKKIILPPIFMSTGSLMFLFPQFHVSLAEVAEAIIVGMIFSIFLIKTSNFEVRNQDIYLIPSKAFVFILVGLLIVRTVAKLVMGKSVSIGETSGMFFLLALGMIVTWRLAMLYKFKKLEKKVRVGQFINE